MERQMPRLELGEIRLVPKHMSMGITLLLVVKGSLTVQGGDWACVLGQDDLVLCNRGDIVSLNSEVPNIVFSVFLPAGFLDQARPGGHGGYFCNTVRDPRQERAAYFGIRRTVYRLMQIQYEGGDQLSILSGVYDLLHQLQTDFALPEEGPARQAGQMDRRIAAIVQYMEYNYRGDISLRDMAEREHLSLNYTSRLFKRETGMGFHEYLEKLRLDNAVTELIYTVDPITKIALNNGFPSASTFNRCFRQAYRCTPLEYRRQNAIQADGTAARVTPFAPQGEDVKTELARYLRRYDLRYRYGGETNVLSRVELDSAGGEPLNLVPVVIKVDCAAELLKSEVQEQLRDAGNIPGIKLVHFRCLFDDGLHHPNLHSSFIHHNYGQILSTLHQNGQIPIMSIDLSAADREAQGSPLDLVLERLAAFLHNMRRMSRGAFLEGARLELCASGGRGGLLGQFYRPIFNFVRRMEPRISIGMQIHQQYGESTLPGFLDYLGREGLSPDFLTEYAGEEAEVWDDDYSGRRHAYAAHLSDLQAALARSACGPLPIFLMEWNTLASDITMAPDLFYRAALIADDLLALRGKAEGAALWLSTEIAQRVSGKGNALSLYMYRRLKRPAYFVLTLLGQLEDEVCRFADQLVVTRGRGGAYGILLLNPCYVNPAFADDAEIIRGQQKLISCLLAPISGAYTVEREILDQNGRVLHERWADMGYPDLVEDKVNRYLENVSRPELTVYEEQITDSYSLSQELAFNGVAFISLRPNLGNG